MSISTEIPIAPPSRFFQSCSLNLHRLSTGHMYTILSNVSLCISLKIANSAHVTMLDPVGAPTNTDSSVRYSLLNDYVMIALNSLVPSDKYRSSASLKPSSLTSFECMSCSSVGAANFSGRIRCLNETGNTVSHCNHLSEITLMKYWGGSGSYRGTMNDRICCSVAWFSFRINYSVWRICSESESSTITQKASAFPCILDSH